MNVNFTETGLGDPVPTTCTAHANEREACDMILHRLIRDESGATAIEYGLIVAMIAIAIMTALGALGNSLSDTMTEASEGMAV